MTSELRPASEVWSIACGAYEDATADLLDLPMRDMVVAGDEAAAAVIEADREAVRAPLLAEIERLTIQLEVESEPSPYCPICGSCGEDGCCGPQRCLYPTTVQAAELAKFKALAETLAGALEEAAYSVGMSSYDRHKVADKALRQYKEARDAE